jgi:hypothetical protein
MFESPQQSRLYAKFLNFLNFDPYNNAQKRLNFIYLPRL